MWEKSVGNAIFTRGNRILRGIFKIGAERERMPSGKVKSLNPRTHRFKYEPFYLLYMETQITEQIPESEREVLVEIIERFSDIRKKCEFYKISNGNVDTLYLRGCDFSGVELDFFKSMCTNLPNLKELSVSACNIGKNPMVLGHLSRLTRLEHLLLRDNDITELPPSFGEIKGLKVLELDGNKLTELPASFSELSGLEHLVLARNRFTHFPEELLGCKQLRIFAISSNRFTELPEGISRLEHLEHIAIGKNQLSSLPDSICRLKNLENLYADGNQIEAIPECIGEMENLKLLSLSGNKISRIPASIGKLNALTWLELRVNELEELPEEICKIESLETLYVSYNYIKEVPGTLANLPRLKDLEILRDNPIEKSELPEGITERVRWVS